MKKIFHILLFAVLLIPQACNKYLDARPDKTQVVPASLDDLQALLDNAQVMNRLYPAYGEAASDNYYVTDADYNALVLAQDKSLYPWSPDGAVSVSQWLAPYQVVYYANQVLESLGTLNDGSIRAQQIKGAALFFRAYAFSQVAALFAKAYDPGTAASDLGIPLRLTADFNIKSVRASNPQTYDQILNDLKTSLPLLPVSSSLPSRPTKIAAYATLARTLLTMGDYTGAGACADSCLALNPLLLDFNTLSASSPNPIPRFNEETLFYAMSGGSNLLSPNRAKIDSFLYASYDTNDLRKTIYFKSNGNGTHAFKGNYDGLQSSTIFSGPATDEVYLIAAECAARSGNPTEAVGRLNALLVTRWKAGTFTPFTAGDGPAALALVLRERRKELVFRGLRWTDLKRLNREPGQEVTLNRMVNGVLATLSPGDPRYAFLIPQQVISETGMAQNAR